MLNTRLGNASARMLGGFAVAALATVAVIASSPHYTKDPTASILTSGTGIGSLKISFKGAGLGNEVTSVAIVVSGTVSGTYECNNKNHSGDPAPVAFGPLDVSASV